VLYRTYTPPDFDALYAIEESCFEPVFRFGRRYMLWLVQLPNAVTWIAEENGRLAGFAIAEFSSQGDNGGVAAYIQTIEVLPAARGRGVGGALLGRIEGSARLARVDLIWLHVEATNARAIRLYEAQCYFCKGRQEHYYPQGKAALIYVKRLDGCATGALIRHATRR
jgi:[ribosomal protein S18]-alanine N-acetyltransferase